MQYLFEWIQSNEWSNCLNMHNCLQLKCGRFCFQFIMDADEECATARLTWNLFYLIMLPINFVKVYSEQV